MLFSHGQKLGSTNFSKNCNRSSSPISPRGSTIISLLAAIVAVSPAFSLDGITMLLLAPLAPLGVTRLRVANPISSHFLPRF